MKLKDVIKAKVAAKIKKATKKVAAKCKDGKCCDGGKCTPAAIAVAIGCALALSGCRMGEQPTDQNATQRAQTAITYVYVQDRASATFGSDFISQAQANDTSGTESQTSSPTSTPTSTPTVDVKPDIDVAYNDAIKNATDASKGVLEKLTDAGASAVLKMMSDKTSGTVTVPTKDGGSMVVKCEDGQCAECTDCTP